MHSANEDVRSTSTFFNVLLLWSLAHSGDNWGLPAGTWFFSCFYLIFTRFYRIYQIFAPYFSRFYQYQYWYCQISEIGTIAQWSCPLIGQSGHMTSLTNQRPTKVWAIHTYYIYHCHALSGYWVLFGWVLQTPGKTLEHRITLPSRDV